MPQPKSKPKTHRQKAVKHSRPSVAQQVTDQLRKDVIARGANQFLGSEEDLLKVYGVSRPTFRQSVRILQHEQLLEVRRGTGGGYYTRAPSVEAVARVAASFLEFRGTTPEQISQAAEAAGMILARQAALTDDEATLKKFADHCHLLEATDVAAQSFEDFHRQDQEFRRMFYHMGNNPALELIIEALYLTARDVEKTLVLAGDLKRRLAWQKIRARIAEATINREPEVAAALTQKMHQLFNLWRDEDGRQDSK